MSAVHVTRGLHPDRGIPILVPWRRKWPAGILLGITTMSLYGLINHSALAARAYPLPMTALDQAAAFSPGWAWIYASILLFVPATLLVNRCVVSLNKHYVSFAALHLISFAVFLVFPTTLPRESYPLSDGLLSWIRAIDKPINCAPSLHASVPVLAALGFLEDRIRHPYWLLFFMSWAVLIGLSTLFTKQHALIDVLTGWALAVAVFYALHIRAPFRFSSWAPDPRARVKDA